MRLAQRRGGNLRKPDAQHLALAHELRQRPHALLDGHALVPAMQVIEVDRVGAQTPERSLAVLLQGRGPAVDFALALRVLEHAALAGQHEFLPPMAYAFADQHLVGAEAVERRGVEMRVAKIQRAMQQPGGVARVRRRAIGMREVHASEPDGGHGEQAKLCFLHRQTLSYFRLSRCFRTGACADARFCQE